MKQSKYYVYVYLDPRKRGNYTYGKYNFEYEPFYIGKGTDNRYLKHLTETKADTSNISKFRTISKILSNDLVPIIVKVKSGLLESEAYFLETQLIKLIGRKCDRTGCLTNIVIDAKPPSNYKQLTRKTLNKIIKLYNDGWYLKHIGIELGLNENKVKRTLIENGLTPKRKPPVNKLILTNEILENMVSDYTSGLSIRKISEKYKLSFEVVRTTLKKNDVHLRGYNYKKTEQHIKKIRQSRQYKTGQDNTLYKTLSNDEIAKLKDLRFNHNKSIKFVIKEMKISQKKFYEYINL